MAHYLTDLGYRVGLAGKSHVAPEEAFPFEKVAGRDLDSGRIGEFIARDPEQPFALIVASTEPHQPWNRGDPSRYDAAALTLPPYFVDTPETREALSRYYAEITFMDGQLGQVLDLLEQHGALDNTLTMFYSEQGISGPVRQVDAVRRGRPHVVRGAVARPDPGRRDLGPRYFRSTTCCQPGSRPPTACRRTRSKAGACSACCSSRARNTGTSSTAFRPRPASWPTSRPTRAVRSATSGTS